MSAPMASAARPEPDTAARIAETAERLFREIGYQKTTVADIAKALKMSPANVYRFFASKKAINEAVAQRIMGGIEGELELIVRGPGTASERMTALIEAMHRMNLERYTDQQRMHEMVQVAICESWGVVHCHIERVSGMFEALVAEGMEAGEFPKGDAAALARCTHVALVRYFHPQLIVECAREPGPTLQEMTRFVLGALRAGA